MAALECSVARSADRRRRASGGGCAHPRGVTGVNGSDELGALGVIGVAERRLLAASGAAMRL
jgi:hypothetical protein